METMYENIENKLIRMTNVRQIEEILPLLHEEGVVVQDIDQLFDAPFLYVGGMLIGCGENVYFMMDLYDNISNFNNSIMTEDFLIDSVIEKMEPSQIIRHFSSLPIIQRTDKEILDNAYRGQWRATYKAVLDIVKESVDTKQDMEMERIDREFDGLSLIKDRNDILVYKRFYLGIINSEEYMLVMITDSAGRSYQHIKLDMDIKTGEILLKINKKPGQSGNEWRDLIVPIHALPNLLQLTTRPAYNIQVDKMDLVATSRVGKLSGFVIGSRVDNDIYEYLNIKEMYKRGTFLEAQEERREELSSGMGLEWS